MRCCNVLVQEVVTAVLFRMACEKEKGRVCVSLRNFKTTFVSFWTGIHSSRCLIDLSPLDLQPLPRKSHFALRLGLSIRPLDRKSKTKGGWGVLGGPRERGGCRHPSESESGRRFGVGGLSGRTINNRKVLKEDMLPVQYVRFILFSFLLFILVWKEKKKGDRGGRVEKRGQAGAGGRRWFACGF